MSKNRVDAVERALTILQVFNEERRELTLTQLAEQTGFYKSTLLRLTNSLIYFGFMIRDEKGVFSLGSEIWRLGAVYRRGFDLAEIIRPILATVRDQTNETASFYIRDGESRVCLYRANSYRPIRHHLDEGTRLPLGQGASSKVLLAFSQKTPADLEEIKQQGFAYSLGERDADVAAIAVPVLDKLGFIRGSLSVSGLIHRFDESTRQTYLQVLLKSAKELELMLKTNHKN